MTKLVASVAAILQAMAVAVPAVAQQVYMAMGQGTHSCGSWTTDKSKYTISQEIDRAWVLGFLTRMNYHLMIYGQRVTNIMRGTDFDGVFS
jgi:hypothetical protein